MHTVAFKLITVQAKCNFKGQAKERFNLYIRRAESISLLPGFPLPPNLTETFRTFNFKVPQLKPEPLTEDAV